MNTAMVLAAGLGTRMRPLTNDLPKALVPVAGQPLIGHILDRLAENGITRLVVNTHYCAGKLHDFLQQEQRFTIHTSHEPVLLETGGGIRNALPLLGAEPFFAINCDSLWLDGLQSPFTRMRALWQDGGMDALLLLQPTVTVLGYQGAGDFQMDALGRLSRRASGRVTPFVYTGVQLLHPRLLADSPDGAFSLNRLYDHAIGQGRLYGLAHDGLWFHVGTPEEVRTTERQMASL